MPHLSEEQLRVRGYIQSQAAKLSVPQIIEKVRTDSAALRDAASAAAAIDSTRKPDSEHWSVNEILAHLTDTCARVNGGILGAIRDAKPAGALEDRLQETNVVRSPIEWWELLSSGREALFAQLGDVTGTENLDVTWNHAFFGDLNWREWLLFLRLHDGDHARQIQGIVAALA